MSEKSMSCEYCDDGTGNCRFPYYGLAPHVHKCVTIEVCGEMVDGISTIPLVKKDWPVNFKEDNECEGMGVYTHCLHCGNHR